MGNQQETREVTEADLGWLAGIIDGEGSISLSFGLINGNRLNNISPRIEIGNTDKELLEKFVRIVKTIGGGIYMTEKKEGMESRLVRKRTGKPFKKIYYAKAVGFLRTKKILDATMPYLTGEKQRKAVLVLRFINARLRKTKGYGRSGKRVLYDVEDYNNMLDVARGMRTKFVPILEGLLRDYTESQRNAA